jgi:DNA-binding MarR family transcriptional regulator
MTRRKRSAGEAATELILEVFRLNGRLLVAGDRLVAPLGLTSARWQVLGAIAIAEQPQPVAWLARSMGLNRQGVQRLVNEMMDDGLVESRPNPHHRRAHHVVLTKRGRETYAAAARLQIPWVSSLAKGLSHDEIRSALRVAETLRARLEEGLKHEDGGEEKA